MEIIGTSVPLETYYDRCNYMIAKIHLHFSNLLYQKFLIPTIMLHRIYVSNILLFLNDTSHRWQLLSLRSIELYINGIDEIMKSNTKAGTLTCRNAINPFANLALPREIRIWNTLCLNRCNHQLHIQRQIKIYCSIGNYQRRLLARKSH